MNWKLMYECYLQQDLEEIPYTFKKKISTKPEYTYFTYEDFIYNCGLRFDYCMLYEEKAFVKEYKSFLINYDLQYSQGLLLSINTKINSPKFIDNVKEAVMKRELLKKELILEHINFLLDLAIKDVNYFFKNYCVIKNENNMQK